MDVKVKNYHSIKFRNLSYTVPTWQSNTPEKIIDNHILRNLNGEFQRNKLSAIIGQSGSGKTSLLNVLTGYTRKNVSGSIIFEGIENARDMKRRMKYIMQDSTLHYFITVREAMKFASNLKLNSVSQTCRLFKIESILDELGLSERADCYTGHLSGGERKRLSIALELVDDPSIIFLDECTTGLDSSSSVQIIQLLKKLAVDRTIVCTIHTPSKLILETFDLIYALSKGQCIYQGSTENIIPFLIEANIPCPDNYNPSEFLIEISNGDYGDHLNLELVVKIENGLNESYRNNMIEDGIITESKGSKLMLLDCNYSTHGRPSFLTQIQQLLMRNFLMTRRDKTLTTIRLFIHIAIATMISFICSNLGNDESQVYNIYKFLFFNIFITMFAAFSSLQTSFPVDLPIIKREHFNGWYSVASYYLALTLIDIPIVFTTTFFYTLIVYFFTSQPLELFRFVSYVLVIFIQALTAQGLGLIAGSVLNVKYTLIFGSFLLFPFVLFSNFFILVRDTHPFWHWIFNTSFIKHAFEASMQVIFGYDRQKLECHTIYCHFKSSNDILKFFDIKTDFTSCIKNIIILGLCFRFIAFIMIWIRLRIKC